MHINDRVEVELTEHGKDVLLDFETKYGLVSITRKGNKIKVPLWTLMNIFGEEMAMGSGKVFVNNEIKILTDNKPVTKSDEKQSKNIGELSVNLSVYGLEEFQKKIEKAKESMENLIAEPTEMKTVNQDQMIGYIQRCLCKETEMRLTYSQIETILDLEMDFLKEQGIAEEGD